MELASRSQLRMSFPRYALFTVPAILLLGTLSGRAANSDYGNPWFDALIKPSFLPPGWAFPVAWTILYICLGIALALILHARGAKGRPLALTLFFAQLALNFSWSPTFFGAGLIDWAFLLIMAMNVAVTATIIAAWPLNRVAALLLVPYLAWLCLATALNNETGRLNAGADRAPLGITGG